MKGNPGEEGCPEGQGGRRMYQGGEGEANLSNATGQDSKGHHLHSWNGGGVGWGLPSSEGG